MRIAELAGGGNADFSFRRSLADGAECKTVREHEVFPALHELRQGIPVPRRVNAVRVSELEDDLRLVERDKVPHAAFEMRRHHPGKSGKALCRLAFQPAAFFLQRLRQLPVVERHPRRNAVFQTAVHHAVIVLEPGFVPISVAVRVDARPACRKPVRR